MGLAEVQRLLVRLSIDKALRDRFFADPEAVGTEVGLESDEVRGPGEDAEAAARAVCRFAAAQAMRPGRRMIPIAARVLGDDFAVLFERYANESSPRGSKPGLDDVCGFVAAMALARRARAGMGGGAGGTN